MTENWLLIETSGKVGQVGLARGEGVIRAAALDATRRHARDLAATQRAAMLAENVLEETTLGGEVEEGEESGAFDGDDAAYSWRSLVEPSASEGLAQVTITVAWNDGHGPKDYKLVTLLPSAASSGAAAE